MMPWGSWMMPLGDWTVLGGWGWMMLWGLDDALVGLDSAVGQLDGAIGQLDDAVGWPDDAVGWLDDAVGVSRAGLCWGAGGAEGCRKGWMGSGGQRSLVFRHFQALHVVSISPIVFLAVY